MKFLLSESYGNTLTQAFTTAMKRGILPTWMGSAELDELELAIKERAVFSARTTNAVYLEGLHEKIGRLLANGYDGDQAKLRLELKQLLAELAYNPETGFPGDAALGIPAARAGSLQDLSSDKRINLILDTQLELMAGKGQEQRGLSKEALDLFPAWELVRIKEARVPRDWFTRFKQAGGRVLEDADGRKRLVAHKLDEVWSVLGDRALFKDALDVSHPPFAFGSGMAWQAIESAEWEDLISTNKVTSVNPVALPANAIQFPSAQVSTDGLSAETLKRLKATMQNAEAKGGKLTLKSIIGTAPPPPSSSRLNALCDELLCVAMVAEINGKPKRRGRHAVKAAGKRCGNSWISAWKKCDSGVDAAATKEQIRNHEDHRIQPKDWEEHHSRSESRRAGDIGEIAARKLLPRYYGPEVGAVAKVTGAEIGAVALGKKPLYHEQWGEASSPIAEALGSKLPKGVSAAAFDGHLIVYRESVVKRVMDSDSSFYRHDEDGVSAALQRVVKNEQMGELLGYGQRTIKNGGAHVYFFTSERGVFAGFVPPKVGAEAFISARRADYQRRFRSPILMGIK